MSDDLVESVLNEMIPASLIDADLPSRPVPDDENSRQRAREYASRYGGCGDFRTDTGNYIDASFEKRRDEERAKPLQ